MKGISQLGVLIGLIFVKAFVSLGQALPPVEWVSPAESTLLLHQPYELAVLGDMPVAFEVVSGPARIHENSITVTGLGTVEVVAQFLDPVTQEFIRSERVFNLAGFESEPIGSLELGADIIDFSVENGIAYVLSSTRGIHILDLSDPSNPTFVAEFAHTQAKALEVHGDIAYLAVRADGVPKLLVIEVSDPKAPRLIVSQTIEVDPQYLHVEGSVAFVASESDYQLIDLSESSPVPLGEPIRLKRSDSIHVSEQLVVNHPFVYPPDFQLIDFSDPNQPKELPPFVPGRAVRFWGMWRRILYLEDGQGNSLRLVDVAQPEQPVQVGVYYPSGWIRHLEWRNHMLFVVHSHGFDIVDVHRPSSPVLLLTSDAHSDVRFLQSDGDHLFMINGEGLMTTVALTPTGAPARLTQWLEWSPSETRSVADPPLRLSARSRSGLPVDFSVRSGPAHIQGNRLVPTGFGSVVVLAEQRGNEQFHAVSAERTIEITGGATQTLTWNPPLDGETLLLNQPYSLAAAASSGMDVSYSVLQGPAVIHGDTITVTDLGTVVLEAVQVGDGRYQPIAVTKVFNRSPQVVRQIGEVAMTMDRFVIDVDVRGGLAFVTYLSPGFFDGEELANGALEIIDVTEPARPHRLSVYEMDTPVRDVVVRNKRAYLAAGDGGLVILDVEDPAHPIRIGTYSHPCWGLEVHGDYAYLMEYELFSRKNRRAFVMVDVSHPEQPEFVEVFELSSLIRDIVFDDRYGYIAYGSGAGWLHFAFGMVTGAVARFDISNPMRPHWAGDSWRDPTQLPVREDICDYPGTAWEMSIVGDLLYLANGVRGLEIHDLRSNDGHRVGQLLTDSPEDITRKVTVDESFAYTVVNDSTLNILDITEPDAPMLVGELEAESRIFRLAVKDGRIYLILKDGLKIYSHEPTRLAPKLPTDLPTELVFQGQEAPLTLTAASDSGLPLEYEVIRGYARVEGEQLVPTRTGQVTVKISHPEENEQFETAEWTREIEILDRQPQSITWIAPGVESVVSIGDLYPLAAEASSGLPVTFRVDSGPGIVNGNLLEITGLGSVVVAAVQEGNTEVAPVWSLRTINPSDSVRIESSGINAPSGARFLDIENGIAFVATRTGTLVISDYRDPENPVLLSEYDAETALRGVKVENGVALCLADWGGIILDVSDPMNPHWVGDYRGQLSERYGNVDLVGEMAYFLAVEPAGLDIVDIGNPVEPVRLGHFPLPAFFSFTERHPLLQVEDQLAFIRNPSGSVGIIDVRDAAQPVALGILGWHIDALHVVGHLAYSVESEFASGFQFVITDVSTPTEPRELGRYKKAHCTASTKGTYTGVHVVGNQAFASLQSTHLQIFDVSSPSQPRPIHYRRGIEDYWDPFGRPDFEAENDVLYFVRGDDRGVQTFQLIYPRQSQSIAFEKPSAVFLADRFRELPSQSTRGLPISYSVVSGPGQIIRNQLELTGEGTVVVRGEQPGNDQILPVSDEWVFQVVASLPVLEIRRSAEGEALLQVLIPEGALYAVQRLDDLTRADWQTVTIVEGMGEIWTMELPISDALGGFYRVLVRASDP